MNLIMIKKRLIYLFGDLKGYIRIEFKELYEQGQESPKFQV